MAYSDEQLVPLSALQHVLFCERQCALIHVAQVWSENALTAQGRILHERADTPGIESRGDLRVVRGLPIRSASLGVSGKADVVELVRNDSGTQVPGQSGRWLPSPVEYKRGRPKRDACDEVQLCAQAICLEQMLGCPPIPEAALYYGETRHRHSVPLTPALRETVRRAALRVHEIIDRGELPRALREKKCEKCSLLELCLPPSRRRSAAAWMTRTVDTMLGEDTL